MDIVAVERWYYVKNGYLWKHEEPDGIAYLRRREDTPDVALCKIDEAPVKYPAELKKAIK